MLKKYGVEHAQQNIKIFDKTQKTGFKIKYFKNTNIYYRGSYELDFLEKYYNKHPDIQNSPSIKYIFKRKNKVYFPDFYIPSKNLIIEIKSTWTLKTYEKKIEYKKKATIVNGFNYIMILDKDYNDFNKLINI